MNPTPVRVTKLPDQEIVRINICRWCAKLERERGLSLKQIAEGVGVSPSALCQWRTGATIPNGTNIENFCIFCGIPVRCLHCSLEDSRCLHCKHPKAEPVICPHGEGSCLIPPDELTPPPPRKPVKPPTA